MKFTAEQLRQLKQIWAEEKLITIKGVNNYGEKFETTGKITTGDKGSAGCYENAIYVEYGTEKSNPDRKQTKWFAPYQTEFADSSLLDGLIVLSVECDGKMIYENADKDQIKAQTKENGKRQMERMASEGLDKVVDCPVVDFLKTKIGQPVRLKSLDKDQGYWDWVVYDGVLVGIEGCSYSGNPILQFCDGPGVFNAFVDATTLASGVGDDMTLEVVVRNDALDFEEKRMEIEDYISDLQDENENV